MPETPRRLTDAERRSDWFPSTSYDPFPLDEAILNDYPACSSAKGMTPLSYAAIRGRRDIVDLLLQAGAVPETEDWSGRSPLDYANDDVAFELISRAMFPEIKTRDQNALAWLGRDFEDPVNPSQGESPLLRALALRPLDRRPSLRIVLSLGADPNERTRDGRTPLSMVLGRSLSSVKLLLERGADANQRWCERTLQDTQTDPACTVEKGITPLMFSARIGSTEAVELLLKYKADKSLRDWAGRTAAHFATTRETWELTILRR